MLRIDNRKEISVLRNFSTSLTSIAVVAGPKVGSAVANKSVHILRVDVLVNVQRHVQIDAVPVLTSALANPLVILIVYNTIIKISKTVQRQIKPIFRVLKPSLTLAVVRADGVLAS